MNGAAMDWPNENIRVFKYTLSILDLVKVEIPIGAEFLHVNVQGGEICAWYRVDTTAPKETRYFRIAGTGHPHAFGEYLGTVLMHGGSLVFHVFDATAIMADREAS